MDQGSLKWRLPLVAVIIGVCLYYAYPPFDPDGPGLQQGKLKLGLDLQGGMQLLLRVDTAKLPENAKADATVRAIEVIRNRIDQFGVSEPSIQQQGGDRILVQLPGISDRQRAIDLIGKTALLEFKLVDEDSQKYKDAIAGNVPAGYELVDEEGQGKLLVESDSKLTGKHIVDAQVNFESNFNEPAVGLELNSEGAKLFSDITGSNVGRRLAIILDGKAQSAPVINERIPSGKAQITGRFDINAANDLAIALRAGALPAPIIIEEERSVGPSLGKDSVDQGLSATYFGFGAVVLFMLLYYLFAGFVANIALLLNIVIIGAALAYFQATLTLPGIAGIVLTIGMAVDANVLIFERIREERALAKPLNASVMAGYKKAFVTILDSNLTTLITALILYYIGTGPIRGFALTLAIGIVASMFTGVFVTRMIFDLILSKGGLKELKMLQIIRKTPKIDYLKIRKACYALSLVVIGIGIWSLVQRGPGLFGVDFAGGTFIEYRFEKPVAVEKVRESLAKVGLGTATIQKAGEREVIIRSPQNSEKQVEQALAADFADNRSEMLRIETVGPMVGNELKTKAVWALIFSLAAIWAYVVWRFDFKFAFGAVLALLHDGLVALGFVALTGRELSVTVLAAVLTILGFSINDTIVIFDRIRERRRMGARESFEESINTSVNQTLSRTILTSLTVFMVVLALFFKGGEVINDFAFTMLVGLISGTYSTVYIAAPVLVDWGRSRKVPR